MNLQGKQQSLYSFYFKKRKNHECKCEVPEEELQIIELKKGEVVFKKDYTLNRMRTHYYSKIDFLLKLLLHIFSLNGNLFFLVVSIIQLSNKELSPFSRWIHITPLIFYSLFRIIKELYFNFKKDRFDKQINGIKVRRYNSSKPEKIEEVRWQDLEVGDIVILFANEYAPADLVLLDTTEQINKQNICYVSTKLIDGKKNLITKKCPKITKFGARTEFKANFGDYCKNLSGKIEYDNPSKDLNEFNGIINLTKDPKAEMLTNENFIKKFSKIKHTQGVVGIVVYTGKHTRVMMNTDFLKQKSNFALALVNKFNIVMILVIFLFGMISTVAYLGRSTELDYIKEYETYYDSGVKFFFYVVQYANFVPLSIYFTLDIIEIIHYRKNEFSQKKGLRKHFISTYNPTSFANFGLIDYVVMDQSALNLQNKLRVKNIYLDRRLYNIKQEELSVKVANAVDLYPTKIVDLNGDGSVLGKSNVDDKDEPENEDAPVKSLKAIRSRSPSIHSLAKKNSESPLRPKGKQDVESLKDSQLLKFGMNIRTTMKEIEYRFPNLDLDSGYIQNHDTDDFIKDLFDPDMEELMKAILLCSEAKYVKVTEKLNDVLISNFQEEKSLLNLAKNCHYFIESSGKNITPTIRIKVRNNISEYYIAGHSESQEKRKKYSVVTCPINKNGLVIDSCYLYIKGPFDMIRPLMNLEPEQAALLDIASEKIYENGTLPYLFAKKKIDREAAKEFARKYKNIKSNLTVQEENLNNLFESLEYDLEFVGMVGLEQQCFVHSYETIKILKQAGVNVWVVTNEPMEKMLVPLNSYDLFDNQYNQFYIDGQTKESIAVSIKLHMNQFQRIYESEKRIKGQGQTEISGRLVTYYNELSESVLKRMSNFAILVSGRAMGFILQDKTTYDNFAFLCAICGRVLGFEFSPEHKEALVKMIQHKFSNKKHVMAVGTTYSDILMTNAADVGVITTNFKENQLIPWGDITVSDIAKVISLLLKKGVTFTHQIDHTVYYLYYKSIAMSLPLFYYNWYASMTGTSLYDSVLLFLLYFLFTMMPLITLSFEKPFPSEYILMYPALYGESRYKKTYVYKKFILRAVIEGVLHSALVFYFSLYHIDRSVSSKGETTDLGVTSLFNIVSLVLIVNFKIFFSFAKNSLVFWTGIVWSLTFLFGFIWINVRAQFTDTQTLDIELKELFARPNTLFAIFFVVLISLAISYVINNYIILKEIAHAWQLLAYKYREGKLRVLKNEEILKALDYRWTLNSIVKTIYKNASQLDTFVLESNSCAFFLNCLVLSMIGEGIGNIGLNKWTLQFKDKGMERRFKVSKIATSLILTKAIYYTGTIFFSVWSLIISIEEKSAAFGFARFIICVLLVAFCFFINSKKYERHFLNINLLFTAAVITVKLVFDFLRDDDGSLATALLAMVMSTFLALELVYSVILNAVLLIVFYVRQFTNYSSSTNEQTFYILFSNILLLTSLSAISVYLGSQIEKQKRIEFMAFMKIDNQNTTYNNILSILVPNFVKNLLNRGIRFLAEDQGKVAILFCDICDFDHIIATKGPAVVDILDKLWRQFDKFCAEHGVQKIETVGKTYMACGGLKSTEREYSGKFLRLNPTKRILNMAIDMMNYVEESVLDDGTSLTIKIGIHYGRAIAGVLGYHKPQFSLIGDTVNTTSRCCSTGLDAKITLSEQAYEQVAGSGYLFEERVIYAKGKGDMKTYVLRREGRDPNKSTRNRIPTLVNFDGRLKTQQKENDKSEISMNLFRLGGNNDRKLSIKIDNVNKEEKIVEYNPEYEDDDIEKRTTQLKPSKYLLQIKQSPLKKEYNLQRDKKYFKVYILGCVFLAAVYFTQSLIILTVRRLLGFSAGFIVLRAMFSVAIVTMILCTRFLENRKILNRFILYCLLLFSAVILAIQSLKSDISDTWFHRITMLELVFVKLVGLNSKRFNFIHSLIFYGVYTIIWLIFFFLNDNLNYEYIFYYFFFAFYILINHYITESNEIRRFNIGLRQNQKSYEQDNLVSQLLPLHAFDKLLRVNKMVTVDLTDVMEDATLLFADIAGFTKFSSSVEPEEVVKMLSELFTEFDQMCVKLKVYKVYTIGDAYVALGFLNAAERNPPVEANNIIKMGIGMIDIIKRVKKQLNHPGLNMRIGVHTGRIIGGIIGTEVVRYDLYGADVLVANKMESNGKEGMIHVSETTKRILEKAFPREYRFEKNTDVHIPSLDKTYEGYFVFYEENIATIEDIPL